MFRGLLLSAVYLFFALAIRAQFTSPVIVIKTEPEYTTEARSAGLSGNVLLAVIVGTDGVPRDIKIVSPLGKGLDQKAIEAVLHWRFKPGRKDGVPVAVAAEIQVSFRLCAPNCQDAQLDQSEKGRALFNTAIHQLRGDAGQAHSEKASFETMRKAAAMGYAPAQARLGVFYLRGIGTPADYAKAAEMFDRAAYSGDAEGEFYLGSLYRTGIGEPKDLAMALKLFERSSGKDNADGEFALGRAYEKGEAVEPDMPTAVKWYRKSAELDGPDAQMRLAEMCWDGTVEKQDATEALMWAMLAEKNGKDEAAALAAKYKAAMPPDRVAEAEKRAQKFKPREPKPKK